MATEFVVEGAQGSDGTPAKWQVAWICVAVGYGVGSEVEGRAGEYRGEISA